MKPDLNNKDILVFSSGRLINVNKGIVGISEDLDVSGGYDHFLYLYENEASQELAAEEQIELADYMLDLWKRFKDRAENKANSWD